MAVKQRLAAHRHHIVSGGVFPAWSFHLDATEHI